MKIQFTIHGEPFGKLNMQPRMIHGHAIAFSPKKNSEYMERIISILNNIPEVANHVGVIFEKNTPVYITIVAYYKVPDSHYKFYKKTKEWKYDKEGSDMLAGLIKPTKKPDLDNISKVICDAISHQGGIWHDDSQITSEMLSKHYSDKPRVEVCIEEG